MMTFIRACRFEFGAPAFGDMKFGDDPTRYWDVGMQYCQRWNEAERRLLPFLQTFSDPELEKVAAWFERYQQETLAN